MAAGDDILSILRPQAAQAPQQGAGDDVLAAIGHPNAPQQPARGFFGRMADQAAQYRAIAAEHPGNGAPPLTAGGVGKVLGNWATGAIGGLAGFPGDIEQAVRWGSRGGADPLAMGAAHGDRSQPTASRPGVSQQNILPTSSQAENFIGGPPQDSGDVAARFAGNLFGPAMAGGAVNGVRGAISSMAARAAPADVRATNLLTRAFTRDNISPQNAADTISQFGSKPVTPMDVGGANTTRLARTVNTLPGEGSEAIGSFLAERQADQSGRVLGDISQNLASGGDVYGQAKQLMATRSAAAKPAYDAAFEGGSIAPLQDQLRTAVQQATAQKGAIQRQITAIEQNSPGAAGAETRTAYMGLHRQLQQAEADRQATLQMFQTAAADASSNAPGAVWSPRLQQFLDQPEVQQGIQRGLKIQRLEAVGNGEPFNPTEYGITGTDESGNPVVSKVPNMRLLDAGKRGLDAMIGDNTDAVTGKVNDLGRALTIAKNGYVSELDNLNPLYKAARDAYAGPSASLGALRDGGNFLNMSPEQLADRVSNMSDSEQQFFRMGAARALQDRVSGAPDNADAVKRIFGNRTIRSQIGSVFGDKATAQFAQAMTPEKISTMTNQFVRGGSNTANKLADIADTTGAQIAQDAATGFIRGGPKGAVIRPLVNQAQSHISAFFNGMTPEVRASLGNLLTQTGPEAQASLLRLANPSQVAGTVRNANVAGIPGILSSPVLRAIIARQAVNVPSMLFARNQASQ